MTAAIDSRVLDAIARHAAQRGDRIALESADAQLSYRALQAEIDALATELQLRDCRRIAMLADNGLDWALLELAALKAGIVCVPLPLFFSPQQMLHALQSASIDTLLVDPGFALPGLLPADAMEPSVLASVGLRWLRLHPERATSALPAGTQKITFTSGTTGEPKGVCLGLAEQERVAEALWQASDAAPDSRHLCVLPLSTLLENIGGLYAPLLAGATAVLRPLGSVGLSGASQIDVQRLLVAIRDTRANSLILVPQMLQALVMAIEAGAPRPTSLRFVAVGGASVSPHLLQRAQALGLPVFEGYGLSECASVVALNRVDAQRAGSVGRPLTHLQLSFAGDGEILVAGNGFRGYVGEPARDPATPVATGDIGYLDAEGFLHISGRKKNIFVTAFGRNVAPEWVERELCLQPAIAQAAVFGEAAPYNVAVIVARTASAEAIEMAIAAVNRDLPDYARVRRWVVAETAFTPANDLATANGRLRRQPIQQRYRQALSALYERAAPSTVSSTVSSEDVIS